MKRWFPIFGAAVLAACATSRNALRDRDGDGIPDDRDECPDDAEEAGGDGDGCPDAPRIVIETGRIHIYGKVVFDTGSSDLLPRNTKLIGLLAQLLKEHPELKRIEVQGHTDATGEDSFNAQLSVQRAEKVRKALADAGIDPNRLIPKGMGKTAPVASNETEDGRARNRRVEFHVLE